VDEKRVRRSRLDETRTFLAFPAQGIEGVRSSREAAGAPESPVGRSKNKKLFFVNARA
jgi:hypothetical protein